LHPSDATAQGLSTFLVKAPEFSTHSISALRGAPSSKCHLSPRLGFRRRSGKVNLTTPAVIHARGAVRNILVLPRGGRMLTDMLFVEICVPDLRFHLLQPLMIARVFGQFDELIHVMLWNPFSRYLRRRLLLHNGVGMDVPLGSADSLVQPDNFEQFRGLQGGRVHRCLQQVDSGHHHVPQPFMAIGP
jgi:hypothetical protein